MATANRGSSKGSAAKDPRKAPAGKPARVEPTQQAAPAVTGESGGTGSGEHIAALAPRARRKVELADEMVTVTVPHPFNLQEPAGTITAYREGIQEMPLSHAEHAYSKAHGVEVYDPK